ncbi:hypothetical protein BD289DRAFT_232978 [Coniella lustricola]|uniref:Uncharacterized protein n=1 Tax=Coniella lustricola TaxID=2025994 RepID=A0A2T3AA08_9PEZI|nr:hypothetical protein BD289DRAFT_232978 [Coniella lustricola]
MLRMSASSAATSAFGTCKDVPSGSPAVLSSMSPSNHQLASAVLIVPILDEKRHGADLLMIPISNNKAAAPSVPKHHTANHHHHHHRNNNNNNNNTKNTTNNNTNSSSKRNKDRHINESASRTETPAAPTPPPKPELPEDCRDWDAYLAKKKSTATLPLVCIIDDQEDQQPCDITPALEAIQSPEVNFKHSFEDLGWRDCLTHRQRHPAARPLRRRPSAATVIGLTNPYPGVHNTTTSNNSSSAVSLRSAKRLSNASTLTANTINTVATAPCYLSSRAYKRLSNASTLTTLTTSTMSSVNNGKPRSIRRINRTRHLRAYYSDGSLLRGGGRRLSIGVSSMADIAERREPALGSGMLSQKRFSSASMPLARLNAEFAAPPPYPPPEKPLPQLPVVEVRELQTRERTRWRELLMKGFQQGAWRRGISTGRAVI